MKVRPCGRKKKEIFFEREAHVLVYIIIQVTVTIQTKLLSKCIECVKERHFENTLVLVSVE